MSRRLTVAGVAMAAVGLLAGAGAIFTIERGGDDAPSLFSGAPSVDRVALPAGASRTPATVSISAPARPVPVTEPRSAREALQRFLTAEAAGDLATSYALLSEDGHRRFSSSTRWDRDRVDRLVPLKFSIRRDTRTRAGGTAVELEVEATHEPSLDPFRGLVPGRAVELWEVVREAQHWRVTPRPLSVEPILPPATAARASAQRWVDARRACDDAASEALQVPRALLGVRELAAVPCEEGGTWGAGQPGALDRATSATPFLAAYGDGVATWSLAVPVEGPGGGFVVVVAPVGSDWRVIGLGVGRGGEGGGSGS